MPMERALPIRRRHLPLAAAAAWGASRAQSPDDPLRVGLSMNNLLSLDPAAATGLEAAAVACNVYDSLLETDAHEPTRLLPALAEAWEVGAGGRRLGTGVRSPRGGPGPVGTQAWPTPG